ncbi:MAG: hypothetical protein RIQ72_425 [Candidatus Parcubacteria bacterium]|jgi:hypothetical protein
MNVTITVSEPSLDFIRNSISIFFPENTPGYGFSAPMKLTQTIYAKNEAFAKDLPVGEIRVSLFESPEYGNCFNIGTVTAEGTYKTTGLDIGNAANFVFVMELLGLKEFQKIQITENRTEYRGINIFFQEVEGLGSFVRYEKKIDPSVISEKEVRDELIAIATQLHGDITGRLSDGNFAKMLAGGGR